MNKLLSDDPVQAAAALSQVVRADRTNPVKKNARVGQDYYEYRHDILANRIFYVDSTNQLKEDKHASNIRIPHPFFTELVDQKVQYLLSNPVEFEVEDEGLAELLEEYYTAEFQVTLQDMVQGASIKATEYLYARTTAEDKLTFSVADSLTLIPIYENQEMVGLVRYYDTEIDIDKKTVTITHAEIWTPEQVSFYVSDPKGDFHYDESEVPNPRAHVTAIADTGETLGRTYGTIPFYRFSNNKAEINDLAPVKAIIDDYDIMNAYLSNNLQDFQDAIYVVKGFKGDNLDTLRTNLKAKKTLAVASEGGLEVQTINIPVEARKLKLEIDRENIYKFGMGFDSSQIGDGNITNIVIKSRYALLDLKCNKIEARFRAMLEWANEMIIADINRRHSTAYNAADIEIKITRETMVNENDIVTNEMNEATAKATRVQAILAAAPYVGDETTLKLLCEEFDLDFEEIQDLVDQQEYKDPATTPITDPATVQTDPITGLPIVTDPAAAV